ncbi:hypothetical protein ACFQXB_13535 [Plastorhodobacter daqingensis]|uniref:Uncharacterized protein n=1 Tax=Plastorhodobacter daqingensis TaxID=1387281 RepID=A0ABW2UMM9_9RHOB
MYPAEVYEALAALAAHSRPALEDVVPNPPDMRLKEAVEHEGRERASDDSADLGRFSAAAVTADITQSPPSEASDEYDQDDYAIEGDDGRYAAPDGP